MRNLIDTTSLYSKHSHILIVDYSITCRLWSNCSWKLRYSKETEWQDRRRPNLKSKKGPLPRTIKQPDVSNKTENLNLAPGYGSIISKIARNRVEIPIPFQNYRLFVYIDDKKPAKTNPNRQTYFLTDGLLSENSLTSGRDEFPFRSKTIGARAR